MAQELPKEFVFLEDEIPNLIVELRYASRDNFMGKTVTGYRAKQKVIGTKTLARGLKKVQKKLKKHNLGLKIFDAYRPQRAVDEFIAWAKLPKDTITKSKYYPKTPKDRLFEMGYIASKSGHSRGSTVDLTLVYLNGNKKGEALDMGGDWDFFDLRSHFNFEELNTQQKENRKRLRDVMIASGFIPYDYEWWHFTVKNEPFPSDYFDFVLP